MFSVLQKKERQYENYLIPSTGISKDKAFLVLYDSVNDILLESTLFHLWTAASSLPPIAVICLWLDVNFSVTCSGVTESMKSFRADSPKHAGDKLDIYEKKLEFGCGLGRNIPEYFDAEVTPLDFLEEGKFLNVIEYFLSKTSAI